MPLFGQFHRIGGDQRVLAWAGRDGDDHALLPGQHQRLGAVKGDQALLLAARQVKALSHCGDTYTVETADGKKQRVWEFNLRLKTDTSKFGPPPGKPVIVGAGMQGDRASVVFASPKEISEFIKADCP